MTPTIVLKSSVVSHYPDSLKLLILTSRFPYPIEKGDKLRLFYQLRELSKFHEIVLCALTEATPSAEDYKTVENYCTKIYLLPLSKVKIAVNLVSALVSGLPLQIGYFYDKNLHTQFDKIVNAEQPDHIYCQLIRTAPYVKNITIAKTIDYMDTFSIGAQRWAKNSAWFLKPILNREAKKITDFEQTVFSEFNHHTIISQQDKNLLQISSKEKITVIPNGVDTSFFHPMPQIKKKYDAVFVGNMGYPPNIQAATFLVQKILPIIQQTHPNFSILIAGARPTAEVKRLASSSVTISGWVDDIRTAYASASIFVAPLFIGMGQQNKILEAMAMGIPCITSDLVNNAIGGIPNQTILIANDATTFAHQILKLKADKALLEKLSKEGLTYVKNNFSWLAFVRQLNILLTKAN